MCMYECAEYNDANCLAAQNRPTPPSHMCTAPDPWRAEASLGRLPAIDVARKERAPPSTSDS